MKNRTDQIASIIRQSIQNVLTRGLSDPRLDGTMLTVTEVDLSPDYANAVVKVSVLPDKAQKRSIAALTHAAAHVRHQIADKLDMRSTPQLRFELDSSTKKQSEILQAIRRATDESEARAAARGAKDTSRTSPSSEAGAPGSAPGANNSGGDAR